MKARLSTRPGFGVEVAMQGDDDVGKVFGGGKGLKGVLLAVRAPGT